MNAIYKFVLGMIGKRSGVVTTLPNQKQIEFQANMLAEKFMQNGIDPNALKSPEQVKNVLANIDQANMRVIPADSAEGASISRGLGIAKKADVMDMEGNKIPDGAKIMGGKEVPTSIDQESFLQRVNKAVQENRESDAAIKARLDDDNKKGIKSIKINLVDDSIAKIKSLEPIEAMKEANLVAGKKGRYANLDDNQVKKIMDDTEDHIFERDIPDEDFATGGRVGLKGGAFLNFIKNMTMNKKSPLQFGKDYLKNVKEKTLKANETGKFMDLPLAEVGLPATTGALVNNQIRKKLKAMNEEQKEENLKNFIMELENDEFYQKYPDLKDETIASYTEKLFGEKKADGGRIGFFKGAQADASAGKGAMSPGTDTKGNVRDDNPFTGGGGNNPPPKTKTKTTTTPPPQKTPVVTNPIKNLSKHFANNQKLKNAVAAGLITNEEYNTLGGYDAKQTLGMGPIDTGLASLGYNVVQSALGPKFNPNPQPFSEIFGDVARNVKGATNISPELQTKYENIMQMADGGRIGYKAGSVDKMRRLFLKAIGAGTAGIGAAKSGIFSLVKVLVKLLQKKLHSKLQHLHLLHISLSLQKKLK
jgi:hypothetical protein